MNRIYLDYAATTPVDARVLRAMQPYFSRAFGNPSSLHSFGQEAIAAVDVSRETIAKTIGADFREIIFTGSATEANNLALRGALNWVKGQGSGVRKNKRPRIIISAIEHESVRETAYALRRDGVEVIEIPVDAQGFVDLKKLEAALNPQTVLVSIIYANNEVGTIQRIGEIGNMIQKYRSSRQSEYPFLHTDAVQAFQFLDCAPLELGVDLMTLSGHKIYGPKGIGALYIKNQISKIKNGGGSFVKPLITGGGQEFGFRSGTENVPLIVGFAKAVEMAVSYRIKEGKRIAGLRGYFWNALQKIAPSAHLTVPCVNMAGAGENIRFLPNILNIYFPDHSAEYMVTKLDILGAAVSSGSACHSRAHQSSYVIEAMGFPRARAERSIRFSFGRQTTKKDINFVLKKIQAAIQ